MAFLLAVTASGYYVACYDDVLGISVLSVLSVVTTDGEKVIYFKMSIFRVCKQIAKVRQLQCTQWAIYASSVLSGATPGGRKIIGSRCLLFKAAGGYH